MKIVAIFRQRIRSLLTAPGDELGRWARFLKLNIQLWRLCGRRLRENNAMAMSAALSFRTLFAMIPALVLALLVLKSVGVLADTGASLRMGLEHLGFSQIQLVKEQAPAADGAAQEAQAINVAEEIEKLVTRVEEKLTLGRIGPVGVVLLIWTALTLLTTIERSLNRIFGAPRSRSLVRRVLIYWSALTLLPVAMATAVYVGREAAEAFENTWWLSWTLAAASWAGPVVIGVVVLAAVYALIPNTAVPFRAAIGGAIIALPLWLIAKWGFAVYVSELVGKGSLYGTLGLLPIFLLYLNLSWWIFLFGAELAHAAASLTSMRTGRGDRGPAPSYSRLLAGALAVAESYASGAGAVSLEEISARLNLRSRPVEQIMGRLRDIAVVCPVESEKVEAYVLAKPAEKIKLLDVMQIGSRPSDAADDYDPAIAEKIARIEGLAEEALGGLTLADVM